MQHHKWSLNEIEGLLPFERDFYVDMLREFLAQANGKSGPPVHPSAQGADWSKP